VALEIDLSGRVAFVTGGSRGLGRADALTLARAGADVAIADILVESELSEDTDSWGALATAARTQGLVHTEETVAEIQALPGDPYTCWVRDPVGGCPPNGEPLERVQARVVRAIDAIVAAHPNGDDVLVVCHGGVISAYLAHCFGLPLSSIWRLSVSNCSLSAVAPPRVLSVNDVSHLAGIEVGLGAPSLEP